MPQVPTYNDRQLRTQALQPVFQNTPDVSSGARALAQGMGVVAEAADRIDLRDAQAAAFETQAKITSEWLQWDAKARQQYRGQNVDAYAPAAQEWWRKAAETYGKDLSPRAKELASRGLMDRQFKALDSVGLFVTSEKERHADETYSADVVTTIQFGVTSGDVAGAAQQIREKAAMVGARKGWTTEQVQAEALKNVATLHATHIERLLDTNPEAAQAYYNKARDANEIPATAQPRIEKMLTSAVDSQFATQFAAGMADKPLAEQLAEAAKIENPERREKALTQIRNNHALVKQAEQERENTAADQAWQLFAQGKRIPETVLSQMAGRERAQLQEAQRTRAERLASGGGKTVKTSPETLAKIYDMMRDDPEGFKKLRMASLTEFMAPNDIEQVARIQRDMLKPEKETGAITAVQAIEAYAEGLDKKDALQFKRRAFDTFDQFQMEKGRAPTTAERRQLLDDLTKEVVLHDGILWDTKGPAFKQEKGKAATPATPVRVTTIEQARALPKGTRFIDPQGVERIR